MKTILDAAHLLSLFFIVISQFRIYWCVLDGADCNRQFIKMHFKDKDVIQQKFVTYNIYTGRPMIFIMDPKVSHW